MGIKRKRIKHEDVTSLLELLPRSKFTTDLSTGADYSKHITELAGIYDLTSYDASYLELARRKRAIVGTLDDDLSKACVAAGLSLCHGL
jgi:predicted nucleic acid-binding protein